MGMSRSCASLSHSGDGGVTLYPIVGFHPSDMEGLLPIAKTTKSLF